MSQQERMMRQLSSMKFAAWELHVFLDTHPGNCEAAKKLDEYRKKIEVLTKQYEDAYGSIHETTNQASRWAWISGPWPWETGEEEDDD